MLGKLSSLHWIVVGAVHRGAANSHLAHELALAIQHPFHTTSSCDFFHCAGSISHLIGLAGTCRQDPASCRQHRCRRFATGCTASATLLHYSARRGWSWTVSEGCPNLTLLLAHGREQLSPSMQVFVRHRRNSMQNHEFGLPAAGKSQKEISR
jgi:hypothetical protein